MKRIVGEDVDRIKRRENLAVEVHLGAEEDPAEGRQVGLVLEVVVIVELGGLGEDIYRTY